MLIEATSREYVFTPVIGPLPDLSVFPADKALIPEGTDHPATGDWIAAAWMSPTGSGTKEVALLVDASTYTPGEYMEFVRIHADPELIVLRSGRVRIGDAR